MLESRRFRMVGWSVVTCLAAALTAGRAEAGAGYSSSVVDMGSFNSTAFSLTKVGKISAKPSSKAGDGGLVLSLKVSGISCPTVDASAPGKCGDAAPIVNHVLDVSVSFGGADFDSVAGVKYSIDGGKAVFQATGKSSIGGAAFGSLVGLVFNQPLGLGILKLKTPGSNPGACDSVPLTSGNACTDGDPYALAGFVVGSDPGVSCASNADCGVTGVCSSGHCTLETCTVDADCDMGGGVGSHQCGSNGTCCDPSIDPTCAGQR